MRDGKEVRSAGAVILPQSRKGPASGAGARQRAASGIRHARAPAAGARSRIRTPPPSCAPATSTSTSSSATSSNTSTPSSPTWPRRRRGCEADRRLPARHPARRDPRAVLGPRGGHRRQRAGRDLRRAREPRRLFPAGAGHDPLRRGQLHLPRHRQAGRRLRGAAGARRDEDGGAGEGRGRPARRRPTRSRPTASTSTRRPRRPHRSADRPRRRDQPHHPDSLPPPQEQPAARRRSRASARPPSPRAWRKIVEGDVPEVLANADHLRARHGRAAGRHALPRRLRGAAEAGDQGARGPPRTPSCSSTRSTP